MADEFAISEDIKIELYLPGGVTGVWGLSNWDSGAKWGSTDSSTWVDIVATVANAEVSLGGSVENGFYVPATPNTMSIRFQSMIFDPSNNPYIRPNVPIRLRYRAKPDTLPTTWTTLFNGSIDSFNVSYDPQGNNLVDLQASSSLKRFLAKNLTAFNVTSGLPQLDENYWYAWLLAVGATGTLGLNGNSMAIESFTDTAAGELLDNLLQVQNGLFYQDKNDDLRPFGSWFMRNATYSPDVYFSNTHSTSATHLCIADIVMDYSLDEAFNTYIINSTVSATIKKAVNQDLVDLYGELRCEKTLHIDPANIDTWLSNTVPKNPGRKVQQVSTMAIRRDGKLAPILYPGMYVGVELIQPDFTINEDLFATRTTHTIDPDNWLSNVELWKGF
jgi:hypothetical protein